MQRHVRTVTLGALVTVMLLPATQLWAQAADPLNGTWELNLAKSKYDPGPAPKSQTRTYEVAGDNMKYTAKGIDAAGKPMLVGHTARYDGKDYPLTGSPDADTISLKRIDGSTSEATLKRAGKVVTVNTRVVSKDGKVMTVTGKGTNAKGEKVNNVLVFDKR
jgi:hypothetical protein